MSNYFDKTGLKHYARNIDLHLTAAEATGFSSGSSFFVGVEIVAEARPDPLKFEWVVYSS